MKKINYLLLPLLLFLIACSSAVDTQPVVEEVAEAVVPTDVPVEPTDEPMMEEESDTTADESISNSEDTMSDESMAEPTRIPESNYDEFEIVSLLPRDAIPAIDNPEFLPADVADDTYAPDELVIGVEFNGDARAYSVPFLSGHEIVNDTVGDTKISVTW